VSAMSNIVTGLIVLALMLVAVLTWAYVSFAWMDSSVQSWKDMVETSDEASRTDIDILDANSTAPYVDVQVHNCGRVHLASFSDWDVLAQYYLGNGTYQIGSLSYASAGNLTDNQWNVNTIYSDTGMTQQEVFEPGILNPGEVALFRLRLSPLPGGNTTNMVAVSTYNGVATTRQFQG